MSKKRIKYLVIFLFSVIFYLLWYWRDGVILTEDAPSYINRYSDREPGYCIFLWLFQSIFELDLALNVAACVQCVIAAIVATMLVAKLEHRFNLHWVPGLGILVMQYGMTLLNVFVAKRSYSYYNSIETEGLAYSLYIFFFLALVDYLYDKDKHSLIKAIVWSVILISIRKQMYITLMLLVCAVIYVTWKEKKITKTITQLILVVAISILSINLIDCTYNYASRGVFQKHTGDSSFILGTEIYLADYNMVEYIDSERDKALFIEIMEQADEMQYNYKYASEGWMNRESHYSSSYDRIKFDIVMKVVREYFEENQIPEEQRDLLYHEIAGTMMKELLLPSVPRLIELFIYNVIYGMITTILKVHPLLNIGAVGIYLAYFAILCILIKQQSLKKEDGAVLFALVVFLGITFNVGLTSATIYCQMRYMLYNTAFFYQAGILMLVELYRNIKTKGIKSR